MFRFARIIGGGLLLLAVVLPGFARAALVFDATSVPGGEAAAQPLCGSVRGFEGDRSVKREPHVPQQVVQPHRESTGAAPGGGSGGACGNPAAAVIAPLLVGNRVVAEVWNYYRLALPEPAPTGILRPPRANRCALGHRITVLMVEATDQDVTVGSSLDQMRILP